MPDQPSYVSGTVAYEAWIQQMNNGETPLRYPVGQGALDRIEIGPGRIVLLGGAPGAGKTALVTQLLFDGLRLNPNLRALCCNVEMAPMALLDRQCARLTGIDLNTIRHRRFAPPHRERLVRGMATIQQLVERVAFLQPPFNLLDVANAAETFAADLIVLDYVQRIQPPQTREDPRSNIDATMNYLRRFAGAGVAILAVSAVGRSKDQKGRNTYAGETLSLASFRESSELEFGADDAFILVADEPRHATAVLRHLKSRYGETQDLNLRFNRACQSFTDGDGLQPAALGGAPTVAALAPAATIPTPAPGPGGTA